MRVSPRRLVRRLDKYQVPVKYVNDWDTNRIDPYNGKSDFKGILLHHTAGTNSLDYIVNGNRYAPVRACHFLVGRDGKVYVVAKGAYHAGFGGPFAFTKSSGGKVTVPANKGNQHLWGIEIESLGRSSRIDGSPEGMTVDQVVSTVLLCVALLDAGRRGLRLWPVTRVIRHKDWAPGRKVDTRQPLSWWREVISVGYTHRANPRLAKTVVRGWVERHKSGK